MATKAEKLPSSDSYYLRISAGPDEKHLKVVSVNDEKNPFFVDGPNFTGFILVRVNNFTGVTPAMEEERKRRSSLDINNARADDNGTADGASKSAEKDQAHGGASETNTLPPTSATSAISKSGSVIPRHKLKSKYFKGRNRRYSIVFQGRFKGKEYNGDQIVFGVDSNLPLHPIPGVGIGIRVCKWLDPALEADLSGNCPHIYTPLISGMNALSIYDGDVCTVAQMTNGKTIGSDADGGGEEENDVDIPTAFDQARVVYPIPSFKSLSLGQDTEDTSDDHDTTTRPDRISCIHPDVAATEQDSVDVKEWAFANSNVIENAKLLFTDPKDAECATTYEKRKKLFGSLEKRQSTIISPKHLYTCDFYDAYFDLSTFTVKVPGFSLSAFKYWDGIQPLRYRCLTRDGQTVFFCIQFDLIPKTEYS